MFVRSIDRQSALDRPRRGAHRLRFMEIGNKSFEIKSTDFPLLAARTMYPDAIATRNPIPQK
jgi:hypothetical protein